VRLPPRPAGPLRAATIAGPSAGKLVLLFVALPALSGLLAPGRPASGMLRRWVPSRGADMGRITTRGQYGLGLLAVVAGLAAAYHLAYLPYQQRTNIRRVLAADRDLKARGGTVDDYLAGLCTVDLDGCPADFVAAFDSYLAALELCNNSPAHRVEMGRVTGLAADGPGGDEPPAGRATFAAVRAAWAGVRGASARHGL
jgi:hypothetical protein